MCNAQYCHTADSDVQLHTNSALSRSHHDGSYVNPAGRGDLATPTAANHSATWPSLERDADDRRNFTFAPNPRTGQLHAPADFIPWKMSPDIHWICWMGSRASSNVSAETNVLGLPGIKAPILQPVVCLVTVSAKLSRGVIWSVLNCCHRVAITGEKKKRQIRHWGHKHLLKCFGALLSKHCWHQLQSRFPESQRILSAVNVLQRDRQGSTQKCIQITHTQSSRTSASSCGSFMPAAIC